MMRAAGDGPEAIRVRGLIIVLWRAGLRISEALALAETDLDRQRGAVLVRAGKGGRRREVGMDRWAWEHYSDLRVMPTSAEESLQAPTFAVACVGIIARRCVEARPHGCVEWSRSTGWIRASSERAE